MIISWTQNVIYVYYAVNKVIIQIELCSKITVKCKYTYILIQQ